MKKNPMRALGKIFSAIAAAEAVIVVAMLLGLLFGPADKDFRLGVGIASFVFGMQILVFGSVGGSFLYGARKSEKKREQLLAGGYSEIATVLSVETDTSVNIQGRHPYRVICCVDRGGTQYKYRSDMVNGDPCLLPGDPIRVYVDPSNANRYYVDVDSYLDTLVRQ